MFVKFLYIVVITIVLFLVAGFFLPRIVHVERSIEIDRPVVEVFDLLNGYQEFTAWSPWAERDPSIVYEHSGPESGVGARLSWSGEPRLVGSGWQEIIASQPYTLIRTRLDFDQQGPAESYFELTETRAGVHLTWGFDTDLVEGQGLLGGLLARYFGLFFDRWIGADYEQGLINVKALLEANQKSVYSLPEIEVLEVPPLDILFVADVNNQNSDGVADALTAAYREIIQFMSENELKIFSPPMAISHGWSGSQNRLDAAIPVVMSSVETSDRVQAGQSPSGRAARLIHRGPYRNMTLSYQKLEAYMAAHDLAEGNVSWEHYISDPAETPESDLITHIYFLIGD